MMKKSLCWLVGLGCGIITLHAAPPHPTQLKAIYKDSLLPVLKVIKTDPVVIIKGKEQRIPTKVAYYTERSDRFASEYIDAKINQFSTMPLGFFGEEGAVLLDISLTSQHDLRGCFILFTVVKPDSARSTDGQLKISPWPQTYLLVRDLPDLKAQVETREVIRLALPGVVAEMDKFVQIFDASGHEVPTNIMDSPWEHYHAQEKLQLRLAMPEYLKKYAGQSRDAFPVTHPMPYFPPDTGDMPTQALALLTVSSEGLVTNLAVSGVSNLKARELVKKALQGWLFFPRLLNGVPVEAQLEVPIKF